MSTRPKVKFMTVNAFKKAIGADTLEVVFNKKTSKLSVLADEGSFYKCAGNLDMTKPMAFLIPAEGLESGDLDSACLVNTKGDGQSPLEVRGTL